jgi:hypothetical protein
MSNPIDRVASISFSQSSASLASEAYQRSLVPMSAPVDRVPSVSQTEGSVSLNSDLEVKHVTSVPYTAHVGEKTYSTEVQPVDNSLYEGSIQNLLGASAIGTTVDQVETRLGNLISFFA